MWAGGKRKMLEHYRPLLPDPVALSGYVEPFAGGAALLAFLRAQTPQLPVTLGDRNAELMGVFTAVRDRPQALLDALRPYEADWAAKSVADRKAYYYVLRKRYWAMIDTPPADPIEEVALLYFLMRTGFNGIWQTCADSRGKYGTPVGLANHKGAVIEAATVRRWSGLLTGAVLHTGSYTDVTVPPNSFVFCDPPYRDSFTHYSNTFSDDDQEALVTWCRETARRTHSVVWLANRLAEPDDGFFARRAGDAAKHVFPVTYTAGRRKGTDEGFAAKKAKEILLVWDGQGASHR